MVCILLLTTSITSISTTSRSELDYANPLDIMSLYINHYHPITTITYFCPSKMSVAQTNESLLKNTIKCQQIEINVLKKDYAALKEKYDALINSINSNNEEDDQTNPQTPTTP